MQEEYGSPTARIIGWALVIGCGSMLIVLLIIGAVFWAVTGEI